MASLMSCTAQDFHSLGNQADLSYPTDSCLLFDSSDNFSDNVNITDLLLFPTENYDIDISSLISPNIEDPLLTANCSLSLPPLLPPPETASLDADISYLDPLDFDTLSNLKRRRQGFEQDCDSNNNNSNNNNNNNSLCFDNGLFPASELTAPIPGDQPSFPSFQPLQEDYYPWIPPTFPLQPPLPLPLQFNYGSNTSPSTSSSTNNSGVTAQSIAARERRRRITEKTQELGRLVPGGSKMNTAEMLGAAFKYVQFLQAQVGILQFMSSIHQEAEAAAAEGDMEELQAVLESTTVQEKLYAEEKCMVLKQSVDLLTKHQNFLQSSDPSIAADLKKLVPS